jgi:hypothetical protein
MMEVQVVEQKAADSKSSQLQLLKVFQTKGIKHGIKRKSQSAVSGEK